jgi:hypothetical protein
MAGYLDQYGAGDERREKRTKILVIFIIVAAVVAFLLWFFFSWDKTEILRWHALARLTQEMRNHRQEGQVKKFFGLLSRQDYGRAYQLWGCSEANPCKEYPYTEFMKDWGPAAARDWKSYSIVKSRSCGSGVIVTAESGGQDKVLWVERNELTIGFSPFPTCPPGSG